ncbi:TPA: PH domain-containing protein [Shewanella algae]|uniref:PH domain-containing protein n=1 Tax=Shewanella algae TaxID=38313 RepID=UPI001C57193A|nr:PH domain-containing protein [Shewanella algae]HDS1211790.1 PH domain-containing protein [Shewanella algae]
MSTAAAPLLQARFADNLGLYWLMSGVFTLCLSIVGIPLLLLWLPIGLWGTRRYIANMSAELTERKLVVRRGLLTRTENTVPLDKITDMALIQGPLMRLLGLKKLKVETAGQSGNDALISLVGIVDADGFRAAVLAQKERLDHKEPSSNGQDSNHEQLMLLREIRSSLVNIESLLAREKSAP